MPHQSDSQLIKVSEGEDAPLMAKCQGEDVLAAADKFQAQVVVLETQRTSISCSHCQTVAAGGVEHQVEGTNPTYHTQ
jgi:hypothetical protein